LDIKHVHTTGPPNSQSPSDSFSYNSVQHQESDVVAAFSGAQGQSRVIAEPNQTSSSVGEHQQGPYSELGSSDVETARAINVPNTQKVKLRFLLQHCYREQALLLSFVNGLKY
jgi:hypothetical protein